MILNDLIEKNPSINLTVNAGDLMEFGHTIANEAAQTILNKHDEKLYSRNEVIEKFQI